MPAHTPSRHFERTAAAPATANERFKASLDERVWTSMIVATALHFALFALWPTMSVTDTAAMARELTHVVLPSEVVLPEPPEPILQPARPIVGGAEIPEDITIGSTDIEDHLPAELLPPPPTTAGDDSGLLPFTPHTVAPRLVNGAEVARALEQVYPGSLRDAGIGGTVTVHLHVGVTGAVREVRIHETSGFEALDRAALEVVDAMRFSPALNLDREVAVWVRQAITFTAR